MALLQRLFGRDADVAQDTGFRLLLAANAVGAITTALVSPLLDTLTGAFGVSTAEIGLLVTAATAPPVVLIPLSGALTDRYGRKPILVVGLLGFGVGGMAIAFTTDFWIVVALRLLQGVSFAGITPVVITAIGDSYEGDAEATAQGLRFGVTGLSQAVFPAIAGLLVVAAWQYPFFIYGMSVPIALAIVVWFEEPAERVVADGEGVHEGRREDDSYLRSLARLAARRRVGAYLVARAIVMLPFIGFLTYNSVIVVRLHGGTPGQAGLLVALFSLVYAAVATQAGRITAAFERETVPLIGGHLSVAGGIAGFVLAPSVVLASPAVVAMGVGIGITLSLYRNIFTSLAPQRLRGGLVSFSESSGRLVSSLAPIAIGVALVIVEPALGTTTGLLAVVVAAGVLSAVVGVAGVLVAHGAPAVPVRAGGG